MTDSNIPLSVQVALHGITFNALQFMGIILCADTVTRIHFVATASLRTVRSHQFRPRLIYAQLSRANSMKAGGHIGSSSLPYCSHAGILEFPDNDLNGGLDASENERFSTTETQLPVYPAENLANSDLYSPFLYNSMLEGGLSSEEGSGLHSPIFSAQHPPYCKSFSSIIQFSSSHAPMK